MTKQLLRKEFLLKRMLLDAAEQQEWITKMGVEFTKIPLPQMKVAMSYFAIAAKNEIVAVPFETVIQDSYPHCRFCYPKINVADNSMEGIEFTEGHTASFNKWGVPEPEAGHTIAPQLIDLILVPLLCFDRKGYRVGYGKGFYDRFIARCRQDVTTIGLSFFEPVDRIADVDQFDIPLTFCVTPERLYRF